MTISLLDTNKVEQQEIPFKELAPMEQFRLVKRQILKFASAGTNEELNNNQKSIIDELKKMINQCQYKQNIDTYIYIYHQVLHSLLTNKSIES